MAAKTHSTPEIPMGKHIAFNRDSKDFDFFYDRQYLGSRAERRDAEECLNEYVYDLQRGYITPTCEPDAEVLPLATEPIYREANGDLTAVPTSVVAYLDYRAKAGTDKVIVSVAIDSDEEPEVLLFGRDGVSLSRFLAAVDLVRRILADPRVQARQAA